MMRRSILAGVAALSAPLCLGQPMAPQTGSGPVVTTPDQQQQQQQQPATTGAVSTERTEAYMKFRATPFSNMELGFQITNKGFRFILKHGGKIVLSGPMSLDVSIQSKKTLPQSKLTLKP